MTLSPLHRLLNPALSPHEQLPSDSFIWTGADLWLGREEAFSGAQHVWSEREIRLSRQLGAQTDLDRLTR
ncbi:MULTISPECIES: hypothetical protein [unclassified Deinococcus]|uniref:hypothetical protein n=1 Tax=unclassified Deinococcus TaxID=2623546 RepID=UPI0006DCCAD5|nr:MULTISPECIES: hypothetical protein [unclassified Deinococcus]MCD0170045.1 hypothetical protein [Deinococcus sp. 23YEL01]PIG96757.1 hypothetical protein AMD26_015530 [Deinococcus sp. UR1]